VFCLGWVVGEIILAGGAVKWVRTTVPLLWLLGLVVGKPRLGRDAQSVGYSVGIRIVSGGFADIEYVAIGETVGPQGGDMALRHLGGAVG